MDSKALKGKSALVTGAGRGIGLACARALAQDGAAVVIMGRDPERLGKAQAQLRAQYPDTRIEMFAGDCIREAHTKAALIFNARTRQSSRHRGVGRGWSGIPTTFNTRRRHCVYFNGRRYAANLESEHLAAVAKPPSNDSYAPPRMS